MLLPFARHLPRAARLLSPTPPASLAAASAANSPHARERSASARMTSRRAASLAALASFASLLVTAAPGCSKPDASNRSGVLATGSAAWSATHAAATAPTALPTPPSKVTPDIDVTALQKKLRCASSAHRDACRILDEFTSGGNWRLRVPSGQGRWAGNAFSIAAGKDKADLLVLSAREVPTSTIAPGDLPFRIGTGSFPDGLRTAATKLVGALMRDDAPGRANSAVAFLETWTSGQEYSVVPTTGDSVRLVAEHETYIRQGKGQKLVLVQPHVIPSDPSLPDGLYAELWPTNW